MVTSAITSPSDHQVTPPTAAPDLVTAVFNEKEKGELAIHRKEVVFMQDL
jgi:hypothetical protein